MDEKQTITIIDDDAQAREALRVYVAGQARYSGECVVCSSDDMKGADGNLCIWIGDVPVSFELAPFVHFTKPVRIGAVGDALVRLAEKRAVEGCCENIYIGPWVFDPVYHILSDEKRGIEMRLTEKEKEILVHLYEHTGWSVLREDLLHAVWGYGGDIETHTLETHIYRLRQKIEKDPARPEILLTTEAGYMLAHVSS